MSSATAGWLQAGLLVAAIAVCYVPLGNYMAHIFTSEKDWKVERFVYKLIGIDSKADQKWSVYVRSILAFSAVSVLFLYGLAAAAALPAAERAHGQRAAGHGLEHRGVVRHQHQLAELRRRVHHGLPGPDDRPDRAAVHVGGRRPGRRDRDDPRLRPVQDRQARQLLGGRDPGVVPAADPDSGRRRDHPHRQRRDRELPRLPDGAPRCPARTRRFPAARSARWRPSRTWGTTAAGSSTPTPRTRSRTPTRGRTGSRSSSCW